MPIRNSSEVVAFDAERALEVALDLVGENLLACGEYTTDSYNVLYLADEVIEQYQDVEETFDVAEDLHSYLRLDFEERNFFDDLYPPAEETYAFVTYTDYVVAARVVAAGEGLYLSVRPGTEVTELVDAVSDLLREGD